MATQKPEKRAHEDDIDTQPPKPIKKERLETEPHLHVPAKVVMEDTKHMMGNDKIHFRMQDQAGNVLGCMMGRHNKLEKAQTTFADHKGVAPRTLIFVYGGQRICPHDTPDMVSR